MDHQRRDGLEHKVERELFLAKTTADTRVVSGYLSRVYSQLRSRFRSAPLRESVE